MIVAFRIRRCATGKIQTTGQDEEEQGGKNPRDYSMQMPIEYNFETEAKNSKDQVAGIRSWSLRTSFVVYLNSSL